MNTVAGVKIPSRDELISQAAASLNQELKDGGWDLKVFVEISGQPGMARYQLINFVTRQRISPVVHNYSEIMSIIETLRTFVMIPKD
jgi:hypothetical protein